MNNEQDNRKKADRLRELLRGLPKVNAAPDFEQRLLRRLRSGDVPRARTPWRSLFTQGRVPALAVTGATMVIVGLVSYYAWQYAIPHPEPSVDRPVGTTQKSPSLGATDQSGLKKDDGGSSIPVDNVVMEEKQNSSTTPKLGDELTQAESGQRVVKVRPSSVAKSQVAEKREMEKNTDRQLVTTAEGPATARKLSPVESGIPGTVRQRVQIDPTLMSAPVPEVLNLRKEAVIDAYSSSVTIMEEDEAGLEAMLDSVSRVDSALSDSLRKLFESQGRMKTKAKRPGQ